MLCGRRLRGGPSPFLVGQRRLNRSLSIPRNPYFLLLVPLGLNRQHVSDLTAIGIRGGPSPFLSKVKCLYNNSHVS